MSEILLTIINMGGVGTGGGSSNMLFMLILLVVPGFLIFYFIKKKKDKDADIPKKRHDGDEVWKTVKDFLKSNNELGKEIIETYVAKRPDENTVDKSLPKNEQKIQKEEIKKRNQQIKEENKALKKQGKLPKQIKQRELYVVLFTTRNAKTLEQDPPRALECEVKMIKKNKHDTERTISINGLKNYEIESKWILPIKEAEEARIKKELERQEKKQKKKKDKTKKDKEKKDKNKSK